MEEYMKLSEDEIRMGFVASCIESVADKLSLPYIEIFERMERVGLIDNYIYSCYDALHTESRNNLTDNLIQTLEFKEREQML